MRVSTIFFDVGETLVDETRLWDSWADFLGVPRLTFAATLGALIAGGAPHRQVFEVFRPGFDLAGATAERDRLGLGYQIEPRDFYPDALAALVRLKGMGFRIGLAGNQPRESEEALRACGVPADLIASSAQWGVEKPSPAFFDEVVRCGGGRPEKIAYVGDRLDNDVFPASRAGLQAVWIIRGPWAHIQHLGLSGGCAPALTIRSLDALPDVLGGAPDAGKPSE